MTLMYPGAIDVTHSSTADPKVPLPGKPWVGGSGNAKLVLHTIEAADPWTIGWPRNWSGWTYAPHLAMNTDRWPDGDWIYQTVPFNKAGYSIRNNSLEDDAYTYQIEIAGQAVNVPGYPDSFYQPLAEVCQWFIDNKGVPDVWADFSCCSYGKYTDCRMSKADVDAFSGFLGHCHVGRGIDTHGDPGHLDVERLRSFMANPTPPTIPPKGGTVYLPLVKTDGYNSNPARREDVLWLQTALTRAGFDSGDIDGKYGGDTSAAVADMMDAGNGERYGYAEHDVLLSVAYDMLGGPHNHDSLYAKSIHSHTYSGTAT